MTLRVTGTVIAILASFNTMIMPALAQESAAPVVARASARAVNAKSFKLTDTMLPPAETPVDSASLKHTVSAIQAADGFAPAPLPDSDVEEPRTAASQPSGPSLEPDFFQRSKYQVGDGFSEGSHISDRPKGHGSAAAGLQLSMPLSQ